MRASEQGARLFVKQIPIDCFASDKVDAMYPLRMFALQILQLSTKLGNFRFVFDFRLQPPLAIDRMPDEITPDCARDAIENQRKENGAGTFADDHLGRMNLVG